MGGKQNQFTLPENIFNINSLFEKTKDTNWKENPFKVYKKVFNLNLNIARNKENFNYYYIDFPVSKQINPQFVIKYFKNIDYRNVFSHDSINFTLLNQTNENIWTEEENYKGSKNIYHVLMTTFQLFFYNNSNNFNTNTSQAKYYMSFKIFSSAQNYILRFELVLNNMDIDQDIDVNIYVNMIFNLLKIIHKKFKIDYQTDLNLNGTNELENNDQTNISINEIETKINTNVTKRKLSLFSFCCENKKEQSNKETQTLINNNSADSSNNTNNTNNTNKNK